MADFNAERNAADSKLAALGLQRSYDLATMPPEQRDRLFINLSNAGYYDNLDGLLSAESIPNNASLIYCYKGASSFKDHFMVKWHDKDTGKEKITWASTKGRTLALNRFKQGPAQPAAHGVQQRQSMDSLADSLPKHSPKPPASKRSRIEPAPIKRVDTPRPPVQTKPSPKVRAYDIPNAPPPTPRSSSKVESWMESVDETIARLEGVVSILNTKLTQVQLDLQDLVRMQRDKEDLKLILCKVEELSTLQLEKKQSENSQAMEQLSLEDEAPRHKKKTTEASSDSESDYSEDTSSAPKPKKRKRHDEY